MPAGEHHLLKAVGRLAGTLTVAVLVFTAGFHVVMAYEGRAFGWWSGVYWTVVTMTTLGYGDIVFETTTGRLYSVLVLLSGVTLLLVLLPYTFIQHIYMPWREAQRQAQAPRSLPPSTSGHVIVTGLEPLEEALLRRACAAGMPTVLLVEDLDEAVALHDRGYPVLVGALDDPDTYRAARLEQAALLVTARRDTVNTNVAFTAREVTDAGIVVATATSADSVDVLELAGCDRVLQLGDLLGRAFAGRILAPHARSREIGRFRDLLIAEAAAARTPLVGRTLAQLDLRRRVGLTVVAAWDRGELRMATPHHEIGDSSVLVLVGTREQLDAYDELVAAEEPTRAVSDRDHVVILGGGRVGRAAARTLGEAGTACTIVERRPERIRPEGDYVEGDAEDLEVLRRAGIDRATAVVVTTHDDDVNVYLTLYCRRLRPRVEILGRVNTDRNVSTMHRAGADFVLSYASTGATEAWNALREDSTLMLAEGLYVFEAPVPAALAGRPLSSTGIPEDATCNVIGLVHAGGATTTRIDPTQPLPRDGRLVLIGGEEAEQRFHARYLAGRASRWRRWGTSTS